MPSAWEDVVMHFIAIITAPSAEDEEETKKDAGGEEKGGKAENAMEGVEGQKKVGGKRMMRLVELDGRRAGPIDHGESKDFLTVSSYVNSSLNIYFVFSMHLTLNYIGIR